MRNSSLLRRSLALGAVSTLTSLSLIGMPSSAIADPGGSAHGHGSQSGAPSPGQGHNGQGAQGNDQGHGPGQGSDHGHGASGSNHGHSGGSEHGGGSSHSGGSDHGSNPGHSGGSDHGSNPGHSGGSHHGSNPGHSGGSGDTPQPGGPVSSQGQDQPAPGGQHPGSGHGPKAHGPKGPKSSHGNPPGNNGTVKIAGPGDAVGHPSNNPHPGCTFYVEWFGFDEGSDVTSTVTFTPQAPTSDVTIGGTEPSSVFVGDDAAGGGTDLDGRQEYTLTFQGTPHPKQGYHVKLLVHTPHSLGNDTKSKVFWVQPCTGTAPSGPSDEGDTPVAPQAGEGDTGTPGDGAPPEDSAPLVPQTGSEGIAPSTGSNTGAGILSDQPVTGTAVGGAMPMLGTPENSSATAGDAFAGNGVAVPTAVDAGEAGADSATDGSRLLWPLGLVGGGAALVAGAALARRRTTEQ